MHIELSRITILKAIIVTLPFGWIDLLPVPYTSLTFVLIYFYFAAVFLAFPKSLSLSVVRNYGVFLFAMWILMFVRTQFDGGLAVFGSWSQLRQILFFSAFFVFAVPDVARMAERGQSVERYFLVAMFGMVLVYFAGFVNVHEDTGRVSLQELNPNAVALYVATAFLILLDILIRGRSSGFGSGWNLIAFPAMVLMLVILYRTGSRGGVLILAASVMAYFLCSGRLSQRQFILLCFAAPAVLSGIFFLMTNGLVAERLTNVGSDIRFQILWPAAIEVVKQYPLLGAGFDRTTIMMYDYVGFSIAPHNELLKIATASGLIGLTLFGGLLLNLFREAISCRKVTGSALRLAILLLVVLQLGKGGGALQLPFIWLMLLLLCSPVGSGAVHGHKDVRRNS